LLANLNGVAATAVYIAYKPEQDDEEEISLPSLRRTIKKMNFYYGKNEKKNILFFFKKLRKFLKLMRKVRRINEKRLVSKKKELRSGGNPNTLCKTAIHICIHIVRRMI
jgi:inorganic triphosphatase YgiF